MPALVSTQRIAALSKGVPTYLTLNGVLCILAVDTDNTPVQDTDGAYLYEAV